MAIFKSIFILLFAIVIATFCVLNAQDIALNWSPLHPALTLPFYAVILATFVTGFLLGAICVWINSGALRQAKRTQKKQIKTLEKELAKHDDESVTTLTPTNDLFPVITKDSSA